MTNEFWWFELWLLKYSRRPTRFGVGLGVCNLSGPSHLVRHNVSSLDLILIDRALCTPHSSLFLRSLRSGAETPAIEHNLSHRPQDQNNKECQEEQAVEQRSRSLLKPQKAQHWWGLMHHAYFILLWPKLYLILDFSKFNHSKFDLRFRAV